jgi:RNA polymerase sigma-70 factor (ECF subfamily)
VTFADTLARAARPGPGRSAAFEHLLRPLLFPVRRYLQAQARDAADDLVDEVLLAVWEHLDRFAGTEAQFRSWVFTISHHRVVDHHRRRRETVSLERVATWRAPDDTETEALARVGAHELRGALAALAPNQREVLMLRIVDDLSIEQTAARLGRSPGAIKALQHRAIEAVRLRIQASGSASSESSVSRAR